MTKEKPTKPKHISLGEYAWDFHKRNDVPLGLGTQMLTDAWSNPNRRTRKKKNRSTPLLIPDDWEKIWIKHYPNG
jgi:hypothetical protein